MGKNRWLAMRNRWCAHHRVASAGHRVELQLLLPPRDGPRGDAVPELQSRHQLSLSAWHYGRALSE